MYQSLFPEKHFESDLFHMEFFIIMIKMAPYLTIRMYNVCYLVLSFSVPFAFESPSRASVTAMEILKVSDLLSSPDLHINHLEARLIRDIN